MIRPRLRRLPSAFRRFTDNEASGGLVLMGAATLALAAANSPFATAYAAAVAAPLAGHSVGTWVNDALMAVFFLLVGLEIKREILHGQLRTWPSRLLPGLGALAGMAAPAAVFAAVVSAHPDALRGWAIPSATDIAFALGVLSLLGDRVPASLKVFLTALAVLDDLGAVLIIAIFYTEGLALPLLGGAALVLLGLVGLNRAGVQRLWPYLGLGAVLWILVWGSGIHPTVAGVVLGFVIPDRGATTAVPRSPTPLHRLENALGPWVAFGILPLFAFANAGVALGGATELSRPVTMAVAAGLAVGKQSGVMAAVWAADRLGIARRPAGASWGQIYGVALLCGIGFTMSLFIGLLAYAGQPALMGDTKLGVLVGSLASALAGTLVLRFAPDGRRHRA
jgi:Na+:H+ antiporter, NhaA family